MSDVIVHVSRNTVREFLTNFTSPHTRRAYARDLEAFFSFWDGKVSHPRDLNISHFITFRDAATAAGKSPATVNRMLSGVKSFMNWSVTHGVLAHNPSASLRIPKPAVTTPTLAFTDLEVVAMLAKPDLTTDTGRKHRFVLAMLFNLGLRRSELVALRAGDIAEDRGVMVLRILGKGGKARFLPLNETVKREIGNYLTNLSSHLGENDFLVQMNPTSVYRIVTRYARECGITRRVSPHSCRATVISHLLENQVSPRDVADFAGHQSIQTTVGIYDKKRLGLQNSAAFKVKYETGT